MSGTGHVAYKFGAFRLVPADKQLMRDGQPVPLAPKVFDTLLLLVKGRGRLVEKDDFLKQVWQDSFVEEVALAHTISQLRKALREGSEADLIETVPKRGYRFLAPVQEEGPDASAEAARATVAVLPFENFSAGPEREYVADGLTEEVIAALGQVDPERVGVIGRTSMMVYKRTTKSLAEIGRELGAGFLVESSIRAEGARLRITSKLIRASDQVQVWSESYDHEPGSVLEFQRELSAVIAQQVHARLSPVRLTGLDARQTRNVEAYDLYLRGRYFWNQLTPTTTRRAVEFYRRATELDPGYALAWSGLADAYVASPINGDARPLDVHARGRDAVAHTLDAGAGLAEAQTSLGMLKFWLDWEWPAAEAALRQAVGLDPGYGLGHRLLGIVLSHMGRHEEAALAMRRARESDSLDASHHALSAQVMFNGRDFPEALRFAQRARVLNPQFWVAYYQLALAHEQLGEYDLALDALQQGAPFSNGNSKGIGLRGYVCGKAGRRREAEEILNTLEAVSAERYVPPYAAALVHAGLGQNDAALEGLERAFDERDVHLALLRVDPKWDAVRADARFRALLKRCGFMAQDAAAG